MDHRERLLAEAAEVLAQQRQEEAHLSTRATGLLAAATVVITLAVGLIPHERRGLLPWWLAAAYVALVVGATLAVSGRRLTSPGEDIPWTVAWYAWTAPVTELELFLARRVAIKANARRMRQARVVYRVYSLVVAFTVAASLILVAGS